MDWDLKFGELAKDTDFVNKCENLKDQLVETQKVLDKLLLLKEHYNEMPINAQIEYDLFMVFMLNSLHWVQLRIKGVDMSEHPIKNELQRVKAAMVKWQQVKDRDKRPKVKVEVAKRFIKSGLYDHKQIVEPANKKTKFEDNEE